MKTVFKLLLMAVAYLAIFILGATCSTQNEQGQISDDHKEDF